MCSMNTSCSIIFHPLNSLVALPQAFKLIMPINQSLQYLLTEQYCTCTKKPVITSDFFQTTQHHGGGWATSTQIPLWMNVVSKDRIWDCSSLSRIHKESTPYTHICLGWQCKLLWHSSHEIDWWDMIGWSLASLNFFWWNWLQLLR